MGHLTNYMTDNRQWITMRFKKRSLIDSMNIEGSIHGSPIGYPETICTLCTKYEKTNRSWAMCDQSAPLGFREQASSQGLAQRLMGQGQGHRKLPEEEMRRMLSAQYEVSQVRSKIVGACIQNTFFMSCFGSCSVPLWSSAVLSFCLSLFSKSFSALVCFAC